MAQVNELLQQMEDFDWILVAATNFSTNRDRIAALKEECVLKKDGRRTPCIGFGV